LIRTSPNAMLDAGFGFGTLAERTRKQPGLPGTQPAVPSYRREARLRLNGNVERNRFAEMRPRCEAVFAFWKA